MSSSNETINNEPIDDDVQNKIEDSCSRLRIKMIPREDDGNMTSSAAELITTT